jgi:hypothetical protein
MEELVNAIEADGTRFYLDTSLLMWLIRLGSRARAEFISWCDARPINSVRVPVWAAHELHRHVIGGTVRSNLQKTVSETQAKYDEFTRLASERADDSVCRAKGYSGRISYIGDLEHSFARLNQLARVIEPDDVQLQQAVEEVIEFTNGHVLRTDIGPVVEKLSLIGDFRYSHLMPPGYHDRKDENRFGDVIIWEELIEDLHGAGRDSRGEVRHAVLISRDRKTDWISGAPRIRSAAGTTQRSNRDQDLDVALAHPLLVHEFGARATGDQLYIVQPGFLASALDYAARSKGRASPVGQWLAASHRPDLLGGLASALLVPPGPTDSRREARTQPPESGRPPAATEGEGIDAVTVADVMAPSVTAEVRAYQRAMPQERADVVSGWVTALRGGLLSPLKFGRILAELSAASAPEIVDQLPAIVERLSGQVEDSQLNRVALAIIATSYFDRHGELRRRPHSGLGAMTLSLETERRLAPAFAALQRFLNSAGALLPYVSGSGRPRVRFVLDVVIGAGGAPRTIRDIRVGNQSALCDVALDSPRRLSALLGREPSIGCKGLELRTLIAREYLIPPDCLSSDYDNRTLTWSASAGLVTLDPESQGGLSALADEENEDE